MNLAAQVVDVVIIAIINVVTMRCPFCALMPSRTLDCGVSFHAIHHLILATVDRGWTWVDFGWTAGGLWVYFGWTWVDRGWTGALF